MSFKECCHAFDRNAERVFAGAELMYWKREISVGGRLVVEVEPRDILDAAARGGGVETRRVATAASVERGRHMDEREAVAADEFACARARSRRGR